MNRKTTGKFASAEEVEMEDRSNPNSIATGTARNSNTNQFRHQQVGLGDTPLSLRNFLVIIIAMALVVGGRGWIHKKSKDAVISLAESFDLEVNTPTDRMDPHPPGNQNSHTNDNHNNGKSISSIPGSYKNSGKDLSYCVSVFGNSHEAQGGVGGVVGDAVGGQPMVHQSVQEAARKVEELRRDLAKKSGSNPAGAAGGDA